MNALHYVHFYITYVLGSGLKIAWDESAVNCRCRNSPWCDFEWNTRGWYSQLDRGIGRLTWEQLQLPKSSWCILRITHKDDWWFRGIWRNSDPIWIPETSGYFRTSDLPKSTLWAMAKGLLSLSFNRRSFHFSIWVLWTMASQLPSRLESSTSDSQVWYHLRFNLWQSVRGPSGKSWRGVKDGVGNMSQAIPSNIFKAFKPLQDSCRSAWYQKILHNQYRSYLQASESISQSVLLQVLLFHRKAGGGAVGSRKAIGKTKLHRG